MVSISPSMISAINEICPGGVEQNVSLASLSQWRIGGVADLIVRPSNSIELAKLRSWLYLNEVNSLVIGATTNLLFSSEGLKVPCIQIGDRMSGVSVDGEKVNVKAGAWVPGLARKLMQSGLSGGEHICGIPGTLGGLICMNGGSQRKSIGSNVISVTSVDKQGRVLTRLVEECGFGYRRSIYQTNDEVISSADLQFQADNAAAVRKDMLAILAGRRKKFPRKQPNCGSVFKSNPAMYAEVGPPGKIIESVGLKGRKIGGAQISEQHANFIVNLGFASSDDVLRLIREIKATVFQETSFLLEAEAFYVDSKGEVSPVDLLERA